MCPMLQMLKTRFGGFFYGEINNYASDNKNVYGNGLAKLSQ